MGAELTSDFLVVGGGTVGAAVAYGLARAGEKVTLLDEGDVALRAARGNFGNVWVQGKGGNSPTYADLTREAANGWQEFSDRLEADTGIPLHFRRPGAFYICFTREELAKRAELMQRIEDRATVRGSFEAIDRAEFARRLPEIGPEVAGATFSPDDGTANPLHLLRALIAATVKFGGRYLPNHGARSVSRHGDGFAVETPHGSFQCGTLVLCAGLANARIGGGIDLTAPVRPVRGQIMVTEKVRPFLDYGTNFIRQTVEGGCIFGESSEEVGNDEGTTLPVLRETARRAVTAFPLLRHVRIVRSWGALRIMTPDGIPVYRQAEGGMRAFVLSVHSGVTLAPFHAGRMADDIRAGALDPQRYAAFSPERFDVQAA